jgi:hypothetical protein
LRGWDSDAVDVTQDHFGREHGAQSVRMGGARQVEGPQKTLRINPDTGVPLAAKPAALPAYLRIGMIFCRC